MLGLSSSIFDLFITFFNSLQMMKVKRMLTETLLEVTNYEIRAVATEVLERERRRANKGKSVLFPVSWFQFFSWFPSYLDGNHNLYTYKDQC